MSSKSLTAIIGIVFLLLPPVAFYFFINAYLTELNSEYRNSVLEETKTGLAILKKELNQKNVVTNAMAKFAKKANRILDNHTSFQKSFSEIEQQFFRTFSKDSKLIYISHGFNFLRTSDRDFCKGRKIWEVLAKSLVHEDIFENRNLADNFVKTTISPHLDTESLRKITKTPIEVIFRGKRYYLALLSLSDSRKKVSGHLFVFLPLYNLKPLWLEDRALRQISSRDLIGGIYNTTTNQGTGDATISDNLMHGFLAMYRKGMNFHFSSNYVYRFAFVNNPKDLFVCVGKEINDEFRNIENLLRLLKFVSFLPFLVYFATTVFFYKWYKSLSISLKTRFNITTLALSFSPIVIMIILGGINFAQLRPETRRMQVEKLRKNINKTIEKTVYKTNILQKELTQTLEKNFPNVELNESSPFFIVEKFKEYGCETACFFLTDDQIFHYTKVSNVSESSQISYLLGMMSSELEFYNFRIDKMKEKFKELIPDKSWGSLNHSHFYESFLNIEIGSQKSILFAKIMKNRNQQIKSIAILVFNKTALYQKLFLDSLKTFEQAETKLFAKSLGSSSVQKLPASSQVNEILDLTAFARSEFVRKLKFKGNKYLALGKSFENIEIAVVGVTKLSEETSTLNLIFATFLFAIISLAFLSAHAASKALNKHLLQPVEKLSSAVEEIRKGILGKELIARNDDEFKQLANSFNKMSNGLKEKAEMQDFLSPDLTANSEESYHIAPQRSQATVFFAGIRNFTSLEKCLQPEDAFKLMNSFLSICETEIAQFAGKIDKYIGETVMASFTDRSNDIAADQAVRCALQIRKKLKVLNNNLPMHMRFEFGIGISSGELISGAIGSRRNRLDYTLIGDTVNLAARLEKLAGRKGNPDIIASINPRLQSRNFELVEFPIDVIKGKQEQVRAFAIKEADA